MTQASTSPGVLLIFALAWLEQVYTLGTKYGCVSSQSGIVTLTNLCPLPERDGAELVSVTYGSDKQIFRHVCLDYPPEPEEGGWPLCTNNSASLVQSRVSTLCNFKPTCSFRVSDVIKDEELNCNTGPYMYFEVQFECYEYKTVCESFVSDPHKLLFRGVREGQVSSADCPDSTTAQEKCLGRNVWDTTASQPCSDSKINQAAFTITESDSNLAELDAGWKLLGAGMREVSIKIDPMQPDKRFLDEMPVSMDFKYLEISMNVARVEFFPPRSSLAIYNFPKALLPRLKFDPALVEKPAKCQASDYTLSFGSFDINQYTSAFKPEGLNSNTYFFQVSSDEDCVIEETSFAQNITFELLLKQPLFGDTYISQCINWRTSSLSAVSEDTMEPCQTEQLTDYIAKCSCESLAGGFFAVLRELAPTTTRTTTTTPEPTSTVPGANTTSEINTTSAETNQDNATSVTDVNDEEDTSTRNGTLTSDVDVEWLLFCSATISCSILLYLIPLALIMQSLCCKVKHSCYKCWFKSTPKVKNQSTATSGSLGHKRKQSDHHAADGISLVDAADCMVNDGTETEIAIVHASKAVEAEGLQTRHFFVIYGPSSAFMAASANLLLYLCSFATRHDMLEVDIGFTSVTMCFSAAWFLLLLSPLLDMIARGGHSCVLKMALPLMSTILFTVVIFGVVTSVDMRTPEFCWVQADVPLVACFAVPIVAFLVILVFLACCTQCRYNDNSNLISKKVGVYWCLFTLLLLPEPVVLFCLAANWSISIAAVLLLVNILCPLLAIALALQIYFERFYVVQHSGESKNPAPSHKTEAEMQKNAVVLETMDQTMLSSYTDESLNRTTSINPNTTATSTPGGGKLVFQTEQSRNVNNNNETSVVHGSVKISDDNAKDTNQSEA
ncbi:uncharacterized protein LOC142341606 isoform X2 [Convolutriloba macropyga]|uniref:uncharacterized protein LOC142341606 isoform X2 n=1 Tax=Convolutriloba macropyga TaxID=536237 RepID=UPI003F52264E